jgi:dienelactone hydrolase
MKPSTAHNAVTGPFGLERKVLTARLRAREIFPHDETEDAGMTRPVGGVRSLVLTVAACSAAWALVACSSDSGDPAAAGPTVTPTTATPTETATSTATETPSETPTETPAGAITPTGKPTLTVPPSPDASIGAACLRPGDGARPVKYQSLSGATITGAIVGRGRAGVVLAHMSDGDLCQWMPYAQTLAKAGYQVLAMDLEGRGSAGYVQYEGDQPLPYGLDVAAAARYLRAQGAAKVVLVGASMGGTSVLAGAAVARPLVNGVVSLSGSPDFGSIDVRMAASRLAVPVLYVAATDDSDYADVARTLYKATKSKRSLTIVPGAMHGAEFFIAPGQPAVQKAVEAFIAAHAR